MDNSAIADNFSLLSKLMDIHGEIQATIEERVPDMMPFLEFVESTQRSPVRAKGMSVAYSDEDLTTVVLAVYLYALHGKKEE